MKGLGLGGMFAIAGVVFALLSLGHKIRMGHKGDYFLNILGSAAYELVAVACVVVALTFGFLSIYFE